MKTGFSNMVNIHENCFVGDWGMRLNEMSFLNSTARVASYSIMEKHTNQIDWAAVCIHNLMLRVRKQTWSFLEWCGNRPFVWVTHMHILSYALTVGSGLPYNQNLLLGQTLSEVVKMLVVLPPFHVEGYSPSSAVDSSLIQTLGRRGWCHAIHVRHLYWISSSQLCPVDRLGATVATVNSWGVNKQMRALWPLNKFLKIQKVVTFICLKLC